MSVVDAALSRSLPRGPRTSAVDDGKDLDVRAIVPKPPRADDKDVDVTQGDGCVVGDPLSRGYRMSVGRGTGQMTDFNLATQREGLLPVLAEDSIAASRQLCRALRLKRVSKVCCARTMGHALVTTPVVWQRLFSFSHCGLQCRCHV